MAFLGPVSCDPDVLRATVLHVWTSGNRGGGIGHP